MAYGMCVYEDVACKAYDILDLKRQHKNFLSNLNLVHVPVFGEGEQSGNSIFITSFPGIFQKEYSSLVLPQQIDIQSGILAKSLSTKLRSASLMWK